VARKVDLVKYEEKRRQILEAAGRCFVRHGFRGTTTSNICAEAGMSPGHLYHYFASKEEIIAAMTDLKLQYMASRLDDMAGKTNAIEALFNELDQSKFACDGSQIALVFEMIAEAGRNPQIAAMLIRHYQTMRDLLAAFLQDGQRRGQVDAHLDTDMAAAIMLAVINGVHGLTIRAPSLDREAVMEMVKTLFSRFLAPPSSMP
jgi:AcrR family transcriptional regulator